MKYVAFLRGINISGKNKIAMADLKAELEGRNYSEVVTYLNSGNVSFSADNKGKELIRTDLEAMLLDKFGLVVPTYVIEYENLQKIIANAPEWWGTPKKDTYDNLIFILSGDRPEVIADMMGPVSDDLETVQIYEDVIFWTFDRKAYQKCNWWKKTATVGIAEKLTIRTANTIKKMR